MGVLRGGYLRFKLGGGGVEEGKERTPLSVQRANEGRQAPAPPPLRDCGLRRSIPWFSHGRSGESPREFKEPAGGEMTRADVRAPSETASDPGSADQKNVNLRQRRALRWEVYLLLTVHEAA